MPLVTVKFDAPPAAGARHRWLMTASLQLLRQGVSRIDAFSLLENNLIAAGRHPQPGEIERTLDRAGVIINQSPALPRGAWPKAQVARSPKWPDRAPELLAKAEATGFRAVDLLDCSPLRFEHRAPVETMAALFPADALLCVGPRGTAAITMPHSELVDGFRNDAFQFVVPSPMSAVWGLTHEGKPSHRSLENVGPRRYAVVEWDDGSDRDTQAARLWFLAKVAAFPLALAMLSGGKSLHGWFYVEGADEAAVRDFYAISTRLGADPAGFTRCQWCRIPDAVRDNGNPQAVLFLNPPVQP